MSQGGSKYKEVACQTIVLRASSYCCIIVSISSRLFCRKDNIFCNVT